MRKSQRKTGSQVSGAVVVAVDFAKRSMKVQAFLDRGTVAWKRGLDVDNTREGVDFLVDRLGGVLRKWRARKDRVVFGGEDPAPYAMGFVEAVRDRGFRFVSVSARKACANRDNTRASSDLLDLDGIAETVRQGSFREIAAPSAVYAELRQACRFRQQSGRLKTRIENQIRGVADLVFPGLLDGKVPGLQPFGPASLSLLEEGLTAARAARMSDAALLRLLRRCGVYRPEDVAPVLRDLASRALPPTQDLAPLLATLECKAATLRAVRAETACEEARMAQLLARTPCAWLLTIPGAGVVLVSKLVAELGDPAGWRRVDEIFSYAGCARRQKQTGGKDRKPYGLGLPWDCNRRLKDTLLQLAFHVGTTPHPAGSATGLDGGHRLLDHFRRAEARGGHSRLSTARLLLRIAVQMVQTERPYLPDWDEGRLPPREDRVAWMNAAMEAAVAKLERGGAGSGPAAAMFRNFAEEYARITANLDL